MGWEQRTRGRRKAICCMDAQRGNSTYWKSLSFAENNPGGGKGSAGSTRHYRPGSHDHCLALGKNCKELQSSIFGCRNTACIVVCPLQHRRSGSIRKTNYSWSAIRISSYLWRPTEECRGRDESSWQRFELPLLAFGGGHQWCSHKGGRKSWSYGTAFVSSCGRI